MNLTEKVRLLHEAAHDEDLKLQLKMDELAALDSENSAAATLLRQQKEELVLLQSAVATHTRIQETRRSVQTIEQIMDSTRDRTAELRAATLDVQEQIRQLKVQLGELGIEEDEEKEEEEDTTTPQVVASDCDSCQNDVQNPLLVSSVEAPEPEALEPEVSERRQSLQSLLLSSAEEGNSGGGQANRMLRSVMDDLLGSLQHISSRYRGTEQGGGGKTSHSSKLLDELRSASPTLLTELKPAPSSSLLEEFALL